MKYPIGTRIQSESSPQLTGRIIGRDEDNANIVLWHDGHREDWKNKWYDHNFDTDRDKIITIPEQLPEDLFEI